MYLNEHHIDYLASQAVTAYELNCSWNDTYWTIYEIILEDYGFKPKKSLMLLIIKQANLKWIARSVAVKQVIEEETV